MHSCCTQKETKGKQFSTFQTDRLILTFSLQFTCQQNDYLRNHPRFCSWSSWTSLGYKRRVKAQQHVWATLGRLAPPVYRALESPGTGQGLGSKGFLIRGKTGNPDGKNPNRTLLACRVAFVACFSLSLSCCIYYFCISKIFSLIRWRFQSPLPAAQDETEESCWAQGSSSTGSEAGAAAAPAPLRALTATLGSGWWVYAFQNY